MPRIVSDQLLMLFEIALFLVGLRFGQKIGNSFIIRFKLYKYILNLQSNSATGEKLLESGTSLLKGYIPYAKVNHEITDSYRFYTLRAYWHLFLCTFFIFIWSFERFYLVRGVDLGFLVTLILGFISFSGPFNQLVILRRKLRFDPTQTILFNTTKPILFLRSFFHEPAEIDLENQDFTQVGQNRKRLAISSLEERLVEAVSTLAPVIAVGKPGEALPQLGAIRFYFDHAEWKEKVEELIALSQIVILQPGQSAKFEGVEWEMTRIKECLRANQIIFSFAHWQAQSRRAAQTDYQIFKDRFEEIYSITLPEKIGSILFMSFDENWTPVFSKTKLWRNIFRKATSVKSLYQAFNKLLKHNGAATKSIRRISRWRIHPVTAVPVLIVSLSIALAMPGAYFALGPYPFADWNDPTEEVLYDPAFSIKIPCRNKSRIRAINYDFVPYRCEYNGPDNDSDKYSDSDFTLEFYSISRELDDIEVIKNGWHRPFTKRVPKHEDQMIELQVSELRENPSLSDLRYEQKSFKGGKLLTTYFKFKDRQRVKMYLIRIIPKRAAIIQIEFNQGDEEAEKAAIIVLESVNFHF